MYGQLTKTRADGSLGQRSYRYPVLSRVTNVGLKGGATVDETNAALISGIPFATDKVAASHTARSARSVQEFEIKQGSRIQIDGRDRIDGRDPLELPIFGGQDHYDCVRFQEGAFGASKTQLDCP